MFVYCGNNPILYADSLGSRHELNIRNVCMYSGESNPEIRDVTDEILSAMESATLRANSVSGLANASFALYEEKGELLSLGFACFDFLFQVNHKAPWDIKRKEQWESTIGTPFPGVGVEVIFSGTTMTPEMLGNFTYGMLGYEYDIPLSLLYLGSYYAAGFPKEGAELNNEIWDWLYITEGYNYAKKGRG